MEQPAIKRLHPDVRYDEKSGQHILANNCKDVAVINPLKMMVRLDDLLPTKIHPDVKICEAGKLLLLHNGLVVGKVIPITHAVAKSIFGKK